VKKILAVAIVCTLVAGCYLFMMVVMPFLGDVISTSNATITADSNWANYPGSQGAFISIPWILWFVPVTIGMVIIVIILKST